MTSPPLARRRGRLTCCLRGGFDRCAIWSDSPVEVQIVAALLDEWSRRCAIAHGDSCDYDLEVLLDSCRLASTGLSAPTLVWLR
jgi:hypothetical protein